MFISEAYAQAAGAAPGAGDMLTSFLPLVLIFVVFYFLLIRPQQKRQKEHQALMGGLQKGDEVVFAGGLLGKVTKLAEGTVSVEIAAGVEVQLQRQAVVQVLPKGTL